MVFSSLAGKLQDVMNRLKSRGKLTPKDIKVAMREIRIALLEADVNFKVVKDFIADVEEKAVGEAVLKSLTPGQQIVKIVHGELTALMGENQADLNLGGDPTVLMLVGLQGSGKTTTAAKLAQMLKSRGHNPLLVAADIYRPAAIDQLETLGKSIDVEVFSMGTGTKPLNVCKAALTYARKNGHGLLLIDTAGRLHIDTEMMGELADLQKLLKPQEILLVADAMTGQDAVGLATNFNDTLGLTGVVLTKMDGDARGGAALSIKAVTGVPIKYIGMGEKIGELEVFHPDRLASRILGMGDILSLIEKVEAEYDMEKAAALDRKLKEDGLTLDDFLDQLQQLKKMGPLDQLLGMIPGLGSHKALKNLKVDDKRLVKIEAIIRSMTRREKMRPDIIDGSRRQRIAKGSGTSTQEVNQLLKQYKATQKMFKSMHKGKNPLLSGKFPF